jgi:hypothetical protein
VRIPELDFETEMGTLGGKFTTLEGILVDIKSQVSGGHGGGGDEHGGGGHQVSGEWAIGVLFVGHWCFICGRGKLLATAAQSNPNRFAAC